MAHSTKKKKDVQADFKKAKLKLGKGKKVAANATNTAISSKAITIPRQSIRGHSQEQPTNRKGQTLQDILVNANHHSPATRKASFHSLKELLSLHPHLISTTIHSVLKSIARLIGDSDDGVRSAYRQFLSWYIPSIPQELFKPFHSLLWFFTTSTISSIFTSIRVDAVRVLDILFDNGVWEDDSEVLNSYLVLLGVKGGMITDPLPFSSLLTIMSSFSKYLKLKYSNQKTYVSIDDDENSMHFMSESFVHQYQYENFMDSTSISDDFEKGRRKEINNVFDENTSGGLALHFSNYIENPSIESLRSISTITDDLHDYTSRHVSSNELFDPLQPVLLNAFLESAPMAISPGGIQVSHLQMIQSILDICITLSKMAPLTNSSTLLQKITLYFPFGSQVASKLDIKTTQALGDANLSFCELASRISSQTDESNSLASKIKSSSCKTYSINLLSGQGLENISTSKLGRAEYIRLLPTLWYLLTEDSGSKQMYSEEILKSLLEHFAHNFTSSLNITAFTFIARTLVIDQYPGFQLKASSRGLENLRLSLKSWYLSLPKVLWTVGSKQPLFSEKILVFLLRTSSKTTPLWFIHDSDLSTLCAHLAPCFHYKHPSGKSVIGPIAALHPRARKAAMHLAKSILPFDSTSNLSTALKSCNLTLS